jgi:hypothetical protein
MAHVEVSRIAIRVEVSRIVAMGDTYKDTIHDFKDVLHIITKSINEIVDINTFRCNYGLLPTWI